MMVTTLRQRTAIDNLRDINLDFFDYWTMKDAGEIGIRITEYDLDKGTIDGELLPGLSHHDLIQRVSKVFPEVTKDYYRAKRTDSPWDNKDIERRVLEEYLILLRKEYEYNISDEAITETIKLNDHYDFYESGELV